MPPISTECNGIKSWTSNINFAFDVFAIELAGKISNGKVEDAMTTSYFSCENICRNLYRRRTKAYIFNALLTPFP